MIRINLLGLPKPKRGRSAAMPSMAGAGPNPIILIVVVLLLALVGNGWYFMRLTHERDSLTSQMLAANAENQRLAKVKQQIEIAETQRKVFQDRVEVVNRLKANQSGPVELLNSIGDTISGTDAVWLNVMKDDGNNVSIDGVALGAKAVANLIGNLKKSGYFKSVEIKETFQDDSIKGMQAFQFSLTCEKQEKKS